MAYFDDLRLQSKSVETIYGTIGIFTMDIVDETITKALT